MVPQRNAVDIQGRNDDARLQSLCSVIVLVGSRTRLDDVLRDLTECLHTSRIRSPAVVSFRGTSVPLEDHMQLAEAAPIPMDLSALGERIRSEYLEMPGLSLSLDQARRLWGLDERVCREVMTALVESGFLRRTLKGTFVKTAA
jgi:hypothetical protein